MDGQRAQEEEADFRIGFNAMVLKRRIMASMGFIYTYEDNKVENMVDHHIGCLPRALCIVT